MINTKHIILLHGALGSKDQLAETGKLLAKNFLVHSFNFEGHGGQSSDHEFSIELFSKNVLNYMDQNKIDSSSFFGYSMGGYVALSLGISYPEKVEKIITYGTKMSWTPEIAEQELKMLNPAKIIEKVPAFAKFLESRHFPTDWKELMKKTGRMMVGLGNGRSLKETDLRQLKHQILICVGSEDKMVSIEESSSTVDFLINGKLEIIPNLGHNIESMDVVELAKKIENFLG